jgi:hypothetical protein
LKRLSDWLYRVSSAWITLLSASIFLVFTVVVLPVQTAASESILGEAGSPDLLFFYTSDELYKMARSYGDEGRDAYIKARFTFDLAWPIVYTLFLSTSISWIFQKVITPGIWLWRMNLLPVFGALADYLENIATSIVMFRYPTRTPLIDVLAPFFTLFKWVLISGSFLILLVGFLIATRKLIVKRTE